MDIFQWFCLFFIPSAYFGVAYLSYFQLHYIHLAGERWLSGMPLTMGITTGLIVIICIIVFLVSRPFVNLFSKIQKENYKPTDADKHMALETYKKINIISVAGSVFGFVFGNMINAGIKMKTGVLPSEPARIGVVFFQSCNFGLIVSTFMVFAMNTTFAKFRRKLHIHILKNEERGLSVSRSIFFLALSVVLFVGFNLFALGFGYVINFKSDSLGEYIRRGLCIAIISAGSGVGIIIMVLVSLSSRIKKSQGIIESLQTGTLKSRIDIEMIDDFGILVSDINKLIDTLSNMLNGLRNESNIVSDSANELTKIANNAKGSLDKMTAILGKIADEGEKQSAEISNSEKNISGLLESLKQVESNVIQSSDAMKESSSSICQMAENISSVAEMTKKADAVSVHLSNSCEKGSESLTSVSKQIMAINEASVQVKNIVGFLQGIARQTNLLAMNAAIEAAHAGEAGQGFAVVAEEVRSLANSSQDSTKKIHGYINEMVSQIELGVQSIEHTNVTFKEIEEGVKENAQLIQSITLAMEEQQQGAQDNLNSTQNVSEGTGRIKELVVSQNQIANSVGSSMEKTVLSTNVMLDAIKEGAAASDQMGDVIERIGFMVKANKDAVETMAEQMKTFAI